MPWLSNVVQTPSQRPDCAAYSCHWASAKSVSAVSVARRNVERNNASGVVVSQSDLDDWIPGNSYDVIVANLFAAVLQRSFEKMAHGLAVGGSLILSGVLRDQWDDTEKAAQAAGLTFDIVHRRGKWIAAKGSLA